jgi:hypothetical protein
VVPVLGGTRPTYGVGYIGGTWGGFRDAYRIHRIADPPLPDRIADPPLPDRIADRHYPTASRTRHHLTASRTRQKQERHFACEIPQSCRALLASRSSVISVPIAIS